MKLKVGFIGLGLIGNPMAKNVLKAGFPLTVYNRTVSKTSEFKKLGVEIAASPQELADTSDVIITMVTGPKDVKEVLFGRNGITHSSNKKLVIVDMSTIGPTAAIDISNQLKKFGISFIDAPVTGGVGRAITGELTIFVGGEKKVFERIKPILQSMGQTIHYLGEAGTGQAVKIINNHLIGATFIALSEGMLLADGLKLSRKTLARALDGTPVMSPMMNTYLADYISGKHALRFTVANLKKDLTLALGEAKKNRNDLPVLKTTQRLYVKAIKEGYAEKNFSEIIKVLEK